MGVVRMVRILFPAEGSDVKTLNPMNNLVHCFGLFTWAIPGEGFRNLERSSKKNKDSTIGTG